MGVTNLAGISSITIYQICWQTTDFSGPCCKIHLYPYSRKTEVVAHGFLELWDCSALVKTITRIRPVSGVSSLCNCTGSHAGKGPVLDLMHPIALLGYLIFFDENIHIFHFSLSSTNCLLVLPGIYLSL